MFIDLTNLYLTYTENGLEGTWECVNDHNQKNHNVYFLYA